MFGRRYFGGRYFGPRYFGPAAGVVIVVANVAGGRPRHLRLTKADIEARIAARIAAEALERSEEEKTRKAFERIARGLPAAEPNPEDDEPPQMMLLLLT